MAKCKVCGTANSPESSVCANCGARLRVNRKSGTKKKKIRRDPEKNIEIKAEKPVPEDIFSTSNYNERESREETIKDVFSSEEAYEKARKGNVLEKIHELEEEIGDTQDFEDEPEQTMIVPTVINRTTSNDLIRPTKALRDPKDKKHDIPHRVIGSSKQSVSEDKRESAAPMEKADLIGQDKGGSEKLKDSKKPAKKRRPKNDDKMHAQTKKAAEVSSASKAEAAAAMSAAKTESRRSEIPSRDLTDNSVQEAIEQIKADENDIEREILTMTAPIGSEAAGKPEAVDGQTSISLEKAVDEESVHEANKAAEEEIESVIIDEEPQKKAETVSGETNIEQDKVPSESEDNEIEDHGKSGAETAASIVEEAVHDPAAGSAKEESDQKNIAEEAQETVPVIRSREIPSVADKIKREKKSVQNTDAPKKKKKKKRPAADTVGKTSAKSDAEIPSRPEKRRKVRNDEGEASVKARKTASAENAQKKKRPQTDAQVIPRAKKTQASKKTSSKRRFDAEDISENRYVAALSYLGVLILLPIFKVKESEFCKAHVKQGAAVFVYSLIVELITLAVVLGLRVLLVWVLGLSFIVFKIAMMAVTAVMLVLVFIPAFEGAVGAFSGIYNEVPFVGKFVDSK